MIEIFQRSETKKAWRKPNQSSSLVQIEDLSLIKVVDRLTFFNHSANPASTFTMKVLMYKNNMANIKWVKSHQFYGKIDGHAKAQLLAA